MDWEKERKMRNKKDDNESVLLCYCVESTELGWLKDNLPVYLKAYDELKKSGLDVSSYVQSSSRNVMYDEISFGIKGDEDSLEKALDRLFSSECGLPDFVLKPSKGYGISKKGYKITEKMVQKHGKKLKSKLDGFFDIKFVE
jgi:hypothetical protein